MYSYTYVAGLFCAMYIINYFAAIQIVNISTQIMLNQSADQEIASNHPIGIYIIT